MIQNKHFRRFIRYISKWAWKQELDVIDAYTTLQEINLSKDCLSFTIKSQPTILNYVAHCFAEIVADSPNYTEMKFDVRDPKTFEWITVLTQRGSGKTPHQFRIEAENQRDELIQKLKQYE